MKWFSVNGRWVEWFGGKILVEEVVQMKLPYAKWHIGKNVLESDHDEQKKKKKKKNTRYRRRRRILLCLFICEEKCQCQGLGYVECGLQTNGFVQEVIRTSFNLFPCKYDRDVRLIL
jgi:hypothetical protein